MKYLNETLKNRTTTLYENYVELDENSIRTMLVLNSISDEKNIVQIITTNIITELANLSHTKYTKIAIEKLIKLNYIIVDRDYKKANEFISVKINENKSKFGIVSSKVILDSIKALTYKELRVLIAYYTHLNYKSNSNYVYPSNEKLLKLLNDDTKYFEDCKMSLIEKGYILKVACIYQYIQDKDNSSMESNGYFLKTGINEISNYEDYIHEMINNKNKKNKVYKLALTTKSYIERKFKNSKKEVDFSKLIFKDSNVELDEFFNDNVEIINKSDIDQELDEKYENNLSVLDDNVNISDYDESYEDNSPEYKINTHKKQHIRTINDIIAELS